MPLKILLADDSLTAQNMGKKILTDAGYEVIAVSNGAQAMKKIVGERPDMVVLDVYMPGYSGLEVCERMRNSRETAQTPVLLSVGKMEAFKAEEASRVRADGVIIKPFEATELLATLKKLAESLSPLPIAKHTPQPPAPERDADNGLAAAEPEFEIQRYSVDIPREFASTPAIGMDLIPEELHESAAPFADAPVASGLIEFEVEHESEPVRIDPGMRMASADGLSGVFEIAPSAEAAVQGPAEPAPVEEFDRFTSADSAAPTLGHSSEHADHTAAVDQFSSAEPPAFAGELQIESFAPASELDTWTETESGSSEYAVEHFADARPEFGAQSADAQTPQLLPELSSWEEPSIQPEQSAVDWSVPRPEMSFPPDASHFSSDLPTDSATVPSSMGSVWVAEETEIEPYESAIPLHEQMQRGTTVSEMTEPKPAESPVVAGEVAFESWEAPEPIAAELEQQGAEPSALEETNIVPEHESSAATVATEEQPEPQSAEPQFASTDFPAHLEASAPDPATEPVPDYHPSNPLPEPADFAADLVPEPPAVLPTIIEAPVDPVRIARIVDQLIERLKPELIAAVTRELEHKD